MATYQRVEFGKPFEISEGQTVAIGEYLLQAVRVPAPRQGKVRLRRSGDFALRHTSGVYTAEFTLHCFKNFFSDSEVLVQILTQNLDAARLLMWPAPPVTLTMAAELARAALENLPFDDRDGHSNFDVTWRCVELRFGRSTPAWRIELIPRSRDPHRRWAYGHPGWAYKVVVDAITGDILSI